jgi:hypothetical protein
VWATVIIWWLAL